MVSHSFLVYFKQDLYGSLIKNLDLNSNFYNLKIITQNKIKYRKFKILRITLKKHQFKELKSKMWVTEDKRLFKAPKTFFLNSRLSSVTHIILQLLCF